MVYEWRMFVGIGKRAGAAFVGLALLAAAPVTLPAPALRATPAEPIFTASGYQACIDKISVKPDDALADALAWHDRGGGLPADHCAAMAMLALGQNDEGARRLDALARDPGVTTLANRAALIDQAGNAWLAAGAAQNAEASFAAALRLTPREADVWTDRARARAMLQNWTGAETDLTYALVFAKRADIYVLRAAARRALNKMTEARADIDEALRLEPRNANALVERGSFRLIAGDKPGARADWLLVLMVDPNGPAGDEARRRIEDLEIGH